jgi:hypothetical protein
MWKPEHRLAADRRGLRYTTAKALGLSMPPSLVAADEVIE